MHKNNGICTLGIVPVRKKADHRSEMVTQLLFGEGYSFHILDNDWIQISTHLDDYEGFISLNQHATNDQSHYGKFTLKKDIFMTDKELPSFLTMGSRITEQERELIGLENELFVRADNAKLSDLNDIILTAQDLNNSPYLWGGRSKFGIDCSGLVQIVYLINGINLPRDANQQIKLGENVSLDHSQSGDLAFFCNPEGKITHVGIVIQRQNEATRIIHASGKVRTDILDEKGIFIEDLETYSHMLHSIKRLF